MQCLAVLVLLAAAAVALPTDLTLEKVPAQCKLLAPNSVLLKNQQLGLFLCEAADSQFVLAADQLIDVAVDKDALLKLRSGELIRHKRQGFGTGFGGASAQSSAFGGGGGFGGGGFPGGYGGGFPGGGGGYGGGGGFAQSSAGAGGLGGGGFYG